MDMKEVLSSQIFEEVSSNMVQNRQELSSVS